MNGQTNLDGDPLPDPPFAELAPDQSKQVRDKPIEVVMTLPRFSLKELFYIITFVAILFAVLALLLVTPVKALIGFGAIILTATLSVGLVHLTRRRPRRVRNTS